jgi:transcriptional regulatory protein LevR
MRWDTIMPFQERLELLVESGQASRQSVEATRLAIAMVERHYGIEVTEELGASLASHLAITMKRLMDGKPLHGVPDCIWEELAQYPEECALAGSVVAELERTLGQSLGRDELGFIAVHLCKMKKEFRLDHKP